MRKGDSLGSVINSYFHFTRSFGGVEKRVEGPKDRGVVERIYSLPVHLKKVTRVTAGNEFTLPLHLFTLTPPESDYWHHLHDFSTFLFLFINSIHLSESL